MVGLVSRWVLCGIVTIGLLAGSAAATAALSLAPVEAAGTAAVLAADGLPLAEAPTERVAQAAPDDGGSGGSIITLEPPRVSPYTFGAEVRNGAIILRGHVPDAAMRERLAAAGADVTALELASGAPEGFSTAVDYALGVLGRLRSGTARFSDASAEIIGQAASGADYEAVTAMLATPPSGALAVEATVRPPRADPFTWSATRAGDGRVTIAGHVPDADTRARLGDAAGSDVSDTSEIADGAPAGFLDDALAGLALLQEAQGGRLAFDGETWSLSGTAASPLAAAMARKAFEAGGFAEKGWTYAVTLPPAAPQPALPVIDPYDFRIERLPAGTIAISGHVPTDGVRKALAARAGRQVVDSTTLGAGAPAGFDTAALAGLDALLQVKEGTLTLAQGKWSFSAHTGDPDAAETVRETLSAATDTSAWTIDIVGPPPPLPVVSEPPAGVAAVEPEIESEATTGDEVASAAVAPEVSDPAAPEASAVDSEPEVAAAAPVEAAEPSDESGQTGGMADAAIAPDAASPPDAEPVVVAVPEPGPEAAQPSPAATPEPPVAVAAIEEPPAAAVPEPSPGKILFDAIRTGGVIQLTGAVPAEEAAAYLAQIAGGAGTDGLVVEPGLPPGFVANAGAGLRALMHLSEGRLGFDGTHWVLTGTADSEPDRVAALSGIAAFPEWTAEVSLTPPLELCRREVAGFSSRNAILFQSGKATMTADSAGALKQLAGYLAQCPEATVNVEGHTDSDGPDDLNLALSVDRAEAVVEALIALGIDASRLYAIGYGESLPVASNDTAAGKAANRRIVIAIADPPH